ncbi:MAG: hypothetical protein VZQ98_16625, partial [Bacteroidales bacterium]|nr:hypothetical protein [Bacteroidales bacterium]
ISNQSRSTSLRFRFALYSQSLFNALISQISVSPFLISPKRLIVSLNSFYQLFSIFKELLVSLD